MKHCLIVDDSKMVRIAARNIIRNLNFEIDEAVDGSEALDRCKKQMPEAILLDWNMPVLNGLEFLQQLRREPDGERPVVVFCTVENDPEHIGQALDAGASEYIMKPFDSDIIESKFVEAGLI